MCFKKRQMWEKIFIGYHTTFLVQFGNNLYAWVFSKSIEIVWAPKANAIWALWKTHEGQIISKLNEESRTIIF